MTVHGREVVGGVVQAPLPPSGDGCGCLTFIIAALPIDAVVYTVTGVWAVGVLGPRLRFGSLGDVLNHLGVGLG